MIESPKGLSFLNPMEEGIAYSILLKVLSIQKAVF